MSSPRQHVTRHDGHLFCQAVGCHPLSGPLHCPRPLPPGFRLCPATPRGRSAHPQLCQQSSNKPGTSDRLRAVAGSSTRWTCRGGGRRGRSCGAAPRRATLPPVCPRSTSPLPATARPHPHRPSRTSSRWCAAPTTPRVPTTLPDATPRPYMRLRGASGLAAGAPTSTRPRTAPAAGAGAAAPMAPRRGPLLQGRPPRLQPRWGQRPRMRRAAPAPTCRARAPWRQPARLVVPALARPCRRLCCSSDAALADARAARDQWGLCGGVKGGGASSRRETGSAEG
mmetsp:Transcript_28154/g.77538  ORF Transcript_28154/g.77538 Transcript_28154/m.77538 type:complete len:282 (-) Transcript_28154:36-881(-)